GAAGRRAVEPRGTPGGGRGDHARAGPARRGAPTMTQSQSHTVDTPAPKVAAPPAPRRKRRWLRRILLGLLLTLVGLGVWVKVQLDRIDREAERFTRIGKAAIALLGEYQSAVGRRDVGKALACFDPGYASDREGWWVERLRSDRDGVQVYEWGQEQERPF